jgi:pimeloyl-ACP methyl ester carboxylesterase
MSALVLDGAVVHYEYFGRGRPLMFIHGWLGSWRYWLPTMDALSEEYRVYAFDLWGFGDSDKSKHEYSVDSYVRLLHSFVLELGVFGAIPLVGHALGAVVAVLFAKEHPDIVDRVMAVSLPLQGAAVNRRVLSGGGSLLDRVLGRSPTAGYEDVEQESQRTAPGAVDQSVQSVMDLNLQPSLESIGRPLLILQGEHDTVVAPMDPSRFDGASNSMRFLVMPGARHFPMLDQSSQFNRLLLDFLRSEHDLSNLDLKDEWQRRIR